jgi:hypothetical protein
LDSCFCSRFFCCCESGFFCFECVSEIVEYVYAGLEYDFAICLDGYVCESVHALVRESTDSQEVAELYLAEELLVQQAE